MRLDKLIILRLEVCAAVPDQANSLNNDYYLLEKSGLFRLKGTFWCEKMRLIGAAAKSLQAFHGPTASELSAIKVAIK